MKLLLVGVNAKYVHTNLAVRYLHKKVVHICDSQICEYSINDSVYAVERDILLRSPDAVALSCYIWNINFVLELSSNIKKANPNTKIILGGPEVSYDSYDVLLNNSFVDFVVRGEGELSFPELVYHLSDGKPITSKGISYRVNGEIVDGSLSEIPSFDNIDFPYDETIDDVRSKIIYYESSRGCPYSCKYCLSGEDSGVRFKDVDAVKKDLSFFDYRGVGLVKFVDRTFNANRKRADEIWSHISTLKGNTKFHMEITGELLTDSSIEVLRNVDSNKLQFEIGVQTTNPLTLSAINRKCNTDILFDKIKKIITLTNIHVHLDLIVGLPHEDMSSFKKSFNDVMTLKPHVLQIGFLKVLKGSAMHAEAKKHGIIYRSKAPYEIISNNWLSHTDVIYLKDFEFVFDKLYNSGSFVKTVDFLFDKFDSPFSIFERAVSYFRNENLINKSFSKDALFSTIYNCFSEFGSEFEKCLRYDYICTLKPGRLPNWARGNPEFRFSDEVYSFLKDEEAKKKYMPKYYDVPAKAAIKHLRFEKFGSKVVVFDYSDSSVYDVSDYPFNAKEKNNE